MSWHRPLFGGLGIASVLFGIGLVFVPAVSAADPVQQLLARIEAVGSTRMLLFTGAGLVSYLVVGLRSPTAAETAAVDRFDADAPEPAVSEGIAGSQLEQQAQTAIEDGGEQFVTVREQLQQTAAAVYADAAGCTERQARAAVEEGTWCADPLAAGFLAGERGPKTPFDAQVRLFVFPRRERRRRIERTVAVIEEVEGR